MTARGLVRWLTFPTALVICGCVPGPVLMKDLETRTDSLQPMFISEATTGFYFAGTGGEVGREIVFSDGTAAGTVLVADIAPGPLGSSPVWLLSVGQRAYFRADDQTDGNTSAQQYELYVTDGTAQTTVRLTTPSAAFPGPTPLAAWGSAGLIFSFDDGTHGTELWHTDGTVPGTAMIADINTTAAAGSAPAYLTKLGSSYYFEASDAAGDYELYKTDGSTASRVLNLNASGSSQPRDLTVMNGRLYFGADQGPTFQRGLYVSDGTAPGTTLVTDQGSSTWSPQPTAAVGTTLFLMANYSDLWVSDGTAGGTHFIATFTPDSEGNIPDTFKVVGSRVVFRVPTDAGADLWGSDGTGPGTVSLATNYVESAVVGSTLFFTVGDGLYETDGTAPGTALVFTQPGLAPTALANAHGKLYFSGQDSATGMELWVSDGTAPGTQRVVDANTSTIGSYPRMFAHAGTYNFFAATVSPYGEELYRSDGTEAGTILLKDISPGSGTSNLSGLTAYGGNLYFSADNGTSGAELWKSNGTPAGTALLKDIRAGLPASSPGALFAGASGLYFYANDGTSGNELWKSDGTGAGTALVKDINAGAAASTPLYYAQLGTKVCFVATTAAAGSEPWCTDGTAAGTALVKDINPGTTGSGISEKPVLLGAFLYFAATDPTSGKELWRTDGTLAGTTRVTDIVAGSGSSSPSRFAVCNGAVFFNAYNGSRWEMWKYDGSTTTMITGAINPTTYSNPGPIVAVGNTLYFGATDVAHGYELYATDGTVAGVHLVRDINPGAGTSGLAYATAVGDKLFFAAREVTSDMGLWQSDGTTSGTELVSGSSQPTQLAECGGLLCVQLFDVDTGIEPYTVAPE